MCYGKISRIAIVLYSLKASWREVDVGEDSSCFVVIWTFGHDVIDRQVYFARLTYWFRLFGDGEGVGWFGVPFSDPGDSSLVLRFRGRFHFRIECLTVRIRNTHNYTVYNTEM